MEKSFDAVEEFSIVSCLFFFFAEEIFESPVALRSALVIARLVFCVLALLLPLLCVGNFPMSLSPTLLFTCM